MTQYALDQADIIIDLKRQTLSLNKLDKLYVISSGKNGIGETENSGKTPRGWHKVAEKFGQNAPLNAVFIARQPTGEVYSAQLAALPADERIAVRDSHTTVGWYDLAALRGGAGAGGIGVYPTGVLDLLD